MRTDYKQLQAHTVKRLRLELVRTECAATQTRYLSPPEIRMRRKVYEKAYIQGFRMHLKLPAIGTLSF